MTFARQVLRPIVIRDAVQVPHLLAVLDDVVGLRIEGREVDAGNTTDCPLHSCSLSHGSTVLSHATLDTTLQPRDDREHSCPVK